VPEIGLDEADRCIYCGAIIRLPPTCCEEAISDFEDEGICNDCDLERCFCQCDDEWCEDCNRSFEYCRCNEVFYD
jgi:hypothetical protein